MLKKLQIGQIMDSLWLILVCLALGGFMSWKMGPDSRERAVRDGRKVCVLECKVSD